MKTLIQKDICTSMVIAALFTIVKMEATELSINRWMDKDLVYLYNRTLFGHKKRIKSAIGNNMDGPRGYNAKWNKSDRERQISYDFTHMWDLRNKTNKQTKKNRRQAENGLLEIE